MEPWNSETNIANDEDRIVKFFFDTSSGPGNVTALVSKGISIDEANKRLLEKFSGVYQDIKITGYKIIREDDDL